MKTILLVVVMIAVSLAALFGARYLLRMRGDGAGGGEAEAKARGAAVRSLVSASRTFSPAQGSAASPAPEPPRGPYQSIYDLVHHLTTLPAEERSVECAAVFREAERLLSEGGPEAREAVTYGLLESVQNITSHADVGAKRGDFEPFLGRGSKEEWDRLDGLWSEAESAAERRGAQPTMTDEIYAGLENVELRRAVRALYRKSKSGRHVSLADVIRFERSRQPR